jgi:alkenylglycerophosphocholine hydrolase
MTRITGVQKALLYSSLAFALVYIASLAAVPYPGHFAVKAVPAVALSVLALTAVSGPAGRLLFVALLLCAAGDVALALDGERFFVIGLALFLFAQLMFIAAFSRDLKRRKSRLPLVGVFLVYAVIMAFVLKPALGALVVPVFLYVGVITAMGIFAALRGPAGKLVLYGALCFIVSDSLLALNEFIRPIPASGYFIMATYYSALLLIAIGFVRDSPEQSAALPGRL